MYLWALRNWRLAVILVPAVILALQVLSWRNQALQLPRVKDALSSCESGKLLTKETNDALQKDRDVIARKLSAVKRVQPVSCVTPARKPDLIYAGREYARADGSVAGTSDDFRDYAAECETYRSERIRLESFIGK